jgi:GntR family transcriptional regulator
VTKIEEVAARGRLAELLGCRPKKPWVRIAGVRHGAPGEPPHCFNEVLIDGAYSALANEASTLRTAIWSLIEVRFGETVIEVDQEIEATLLDEELAKLLEAEAGAPALKFTRRYFVTGRRMVELSVSVHPADRFTYRMTIRRDNTVASF